MKCGRAQRLRYDARVLLSKISDHLVIAPKIAVNGSIKRIDQIGYPNFLRMKISTKNIAVNAKQNRVDSAKKTVSV